jgi:hypothetical protein
MTTISNFDILLLTGFFAGIASFFRGFGNYRKYLLLQGTPAIPIRSMAMGLVRIHGKAAGDQTIESPVSQSACCVFQVHIEKWKDEEDSGRWMHYGADTNGVSFHLEDSSGRVLVDPRGAEFDIESTAVRDISSARTSAVTDTELLAYVLHVGPGPELPGSRHNLELEQAMLTFKSARQSATPDEMFQKLVGSQYSEMQQSLAGIQQSLEDEGPQSDPLIEELRLAQIDLYKHPFWSKEYAASAKHVADLQARARKAGLMTVPPPPSAKSAPQADSASPENIVASIEGRPSATGRYRLTERCILPGHEYDVTGTCAINPIANSADERNVIRKGTNEPTFLISALARSGVDAMQKFRSYFLIFGGGMLAVFCLGILLLRFGQF